MTFDLNALVVLSLLASIAIIYAISLEAAFLRVYLPLLLLLPDGNTWGWPPFNFHQYAIIPIGLGLCWWTLNGRWKLSWNDIFVCGFIAWTIISDIHAGGMTDIVGRIVTPLTLALFPYMAGKLLIEQTGIRVAVARRFVFCLFIDVLISVYEFRFGVNPFRIVLGSFLNSGTPWTDTQIRYGYGRTSGPFGHAILMGAIVAVAILLHRYLMHFGLWEKRFRWFPNLKLNKAWVLLCGLIGGSIMTLSRGPWLAVVVGGLVNSVGTAQNRRLAFRRTIMVMVIGGTLVYLGGKAYLASAEADASREEAASALYRAQLFDEYEQIASRQSFWGWGSSDWPRVSGAESVDNWYLLLALMHGLTGLLLFVLMLVVPIWRMLWIGMVDDSLTPDRRALLFNLSAIIVTIGVAVATVFLGSQLYPLLFLFLGWSDAALVCRSERSMMTAPAFAFRKVIA